MFFRDARYCSEKRRGQVVRTAVLSARDIKRAGEEREFVETKVLSRHLDMFDCRGINRRGWGA